jgi:hypothetical protein
MPRSVLFVGLLSTLLLVSAPGRAACFGSDAFQTCNDQYGNQYTVNRLGNTTTVYGSNPSTGSQWNETVNHFGNMTQYNGLTNGSPWNMTRQDFGGTTTYNGMNSAGQPFYYTCTPYGGCR